MYQSLLLPWSPPHIASAHETAYRHAGLLRTKGTIFLLPPPLSTLKLAYTTPPRHRSRMSAGAVALCKHFERGGASSEHRRMHPYWDVPRGSNGEKDRIAERVLERMLAEICWKNVMLLHRGVAVYEVRNNKGWGMRWSLDVVVEDGKEDGLTEEMETDDLDGDILVIQHSRTRGDDKGDDDPANGAEQHSVKDEDNVQDQPAMVTNVSSSVTYDTDLTWRIIKTSFRGFVEPIEGMNHELDET